MIISNDPAWKNVTPEKSTRDQIGADWENQTEKNPNQHVLIQ